MSKQEIIKRRIVVGLTAEQQQVKNTLHQYLGKDFKAIINDAFIYMDDAKIEALIKLYKEQLVCSE